MQGARGAHSTSRSSYRTLPGPGARRGGAATPLDAVEQPEPALGLLSPFMSVSMWPVSRTNDRWVLRGVAAEGLSAMRGYRRHPGCSGEQRGQVFERIDGAAPGTEQTPPLDPAQVNQPEVAGRRSGSAVAEPFLTTIKRELIDSQGVADPSRAAGGGLRPHRGPAAGGGLRPHRGLVRHPEASRLSWLHEPCTRRSAHPPLSRGPGGIVNKANPSVEGRQPQGPGLATECSLSAGLSRRASGWRARRRGQVQGGSALIWLASSGRKAPRRAKVCPTCRDAGQPTLAHALAHRMLGARRRHA